MKKNVSNPILSLDNVSKNFAGVKAVSNISTDIAYGERRLLIGTNGAGKTTLFNLIGGDLPVSSGRIEIFGHNVSGFSVEKRARLKMRRTYQTPELFNELSVRENFYLSLLGEEKTWNHLNVFKQYRKDYEKNDRINETAKTVGIFNKLDEEVSSLSHGEKKQLEFGLAIITKPELLLLDEPAAGLSENEKQIMTKLIKSLKRDVTIVMIEHNIEMGFEIADNVSVMLDGEMFAEGTPEEIKNNNEVQTIYLGGALG